jgi:hypothetical protein
MIWKCVGITTVCKNLCIKENQQDWIISTKADTEVNWKEISLKRKTEELRVTFAGPEGQFKPVRV